MVAKNQVIIILNVGYTAVTRNELSGYLAIWINIIFVVQYYVCTFNTNSNVHILKTFSHIYM